MLLDQIKAQKAAKTKAPSPFNRVAVLFFQEFFEHRKKKGSGIPSEANFSPGGPPDPPEGAAVPSDANFSPGQPPDPPEGAAVPSDANFSPGQPL